MPPRPPRAPRGPTAPRNPDPRSANPSGQRPQEDRPTPSSAGPPQRNDERQERAASRSKYGEDRPSRPQRHDQDRAAPPIRTSPPVDSGEGEWFGEETTESPRRSFPKADRDPNELRTYGLHACEALFENRAGDIVRVYVTEDRIKQVGIMLRWCASKKKAYHVVTEDDLAKITASVHHEGICILAKAGPLLDDEGLLARVAARRGPTCLIYLDGVQNPHNIGSILRVAAHFGTPFLAGPASAMPRLSSSAVRVAEGGAERVAVAALKRPDETLAALKARGFALYATSSHEGTSLFGATLPERAVIILGAEGPGMSQRLMAAADHTLRIPGTRAVESLNVATASGLLLGEFWRQHVQNG